MALCLTEMRRWRAGVTARHVVNNGRRQGLDRPLLRSRCRCIGDLFEEADLKHHHAGVVLNVFYGDMSYGACVCFFRWLSDGVKLGMPAAMAIANES